MLSASVFVAAALGYRYIISARRNRSGHNRHTNNDAVGEKEKVPPDGFEVATTRMMLPDDANPVRAGSGFIFLHATCINYANS